MTFFKHKLSFVILKLDQNQKLSVLMYFEIILLRFSDGGPSKISRKRLSIYYGINLQSISNSDFQI